VTEKKLTWAAFIGIVLLAAFFRFYAMDQVPPGPHYDETIDARLALDIRAGARPVFFSQGWGREPLYHYLVAFVMNWIDMPLTALRVTSAILGTLAVALAFLLLRRLFDWRMAAIGSAWMACSFWTISVSRLGVRDIAVQPFAVGAMLAFWQWKKSSSSSSSKAIIWSVASGALLGLALYTYQSSRALPILIVLFIAYLVIFDRKQLASQWKCLILCLTLAAVIAAPLVIFLAIHPDAESGRAFMSEPIQQLLRGNAGPALAGAFATLKMFTFSGDAQVLYNVPGRPALALLAGAMFYIGLILALARFKQSEYAFVLLWLFTALAPAMVTFPAPNFFRTVLAQAPTAALIAIGVSATGDLIMRVARGAQWARPVIPLIAVFVVGQTAWQTWNDYFVTWANLRDVRFQYNAGPAAAARYLDTSADTDPVVLTGLFVEDSDPVNFSILLHRRDLDLRWFDASSALPVPASAQTLRLVVYDFAPLNDLLRKRYMADAKLIAEEPDVFWVYRLNADDVRAKLEQAQGQVQAASGMALTLPVSFSDGLSLLGYDVSSRKLAPGGELTLMTRWRATKPGTPQPVAIFAHLMNPSGKLVAQDDRLGYPHHTWHADDEFVQVHRVTIPPETAPGTYTLNLGLYFRDTMVRWPVAGSDLVSLGSVEVEPTSKVSP
jgi:4-amino-4-deoxy-L-arabinose transferase-like glycosyltransferase